MGSIPLSVGGSAGMMYSVICSDSVEAVEDVDGVDDVSGEWVVTPE